MLTDLKCPKCGREIHDSFEDGNPDGGLFCINCGYIPKDDEILKNQNKLKKYSFISK